jgi:transcriptional regulator with XRE-family HTH domain
MKDLFNEILQNTPLEDKIRIEDQMEIALRINLAMQKKGWRQVDLAKSLGKKKSEISKYLSGTHNFTIETLSKLQAVLGVRFLLKNCEEITYEDESSNYPHKSKSHKSSYLYRVNDSPEEYHKNKTNKQKK